MNYLSNFSLLEYSIASENQTLGEYNLNTGLILEYSNVSLPGLIIVFNVIIVCSMSYYSNNAIRILVLEQ